MHINTFSEVLWWVLLVLKEKKKSKETLLSHVACRSVVPYSLVFWPQATWVWVWVKFFFVFFYAFYGNFSVCLACFSNFLWNIRVSYLIWQFSIKTNKSPVCENLWLLYCLSLHHDNPPSKILRTVKCKAAEMKVSSKSLEHISWGKHVPRGPLRHRVIRWRLSKHCCSLGWEIREREGEMERELCRLSRCASSVKSWGVSKI